jgi:hypothetical protein
MTQLLSRPVLRVQPTEPAPSRPLSLSCLIAVGWSAAVGLIACVAVAVGVWFAGETGSFEDAIRVGVFAWLLGNGSGLVLDSTSVTAIPLGLSLLWGWLLYRGGRWAGTHSAIRGDLDVVASIAATAALYAGVGGVAATLAATDAASAELVRSCVAPGLLGLVCGGLGVLRGSGRGGRAFRRLPELVRASVVGGLAGAFAMVGAGALLLTASMVVHFPAVVTLSEGADAGALGAAVLTLVGAAVIPNAVLAAGAFIAGPGFMVGTGTTVAPGDITIGALPAFPLLGALPQGSETHWWHGLLLVVPVLAGGVAGFVSIRRHPVFGLDHAALRGCLAGLLGGTLFGLSTFLATGAVGPGRMSDVGPYAAETLLVCAVAFMLGGGVAATGARWVESVTARRRREGAGATRDAVPDVQPDVVPVGSDSH